MTLSAFPETAEVDRYRDLAEQAIREAAEKSARASAEWESLARRAAEKTAVEASEGAVKEAATKAAQAAAEETAKAAQTAAEEAAKIAAEETAKRYQDEKAAKEEQLAVRRAIGTRVFRMAHANAVEVAEKLNRMWSGDFGESWKISQMAVPFEESNAVMVTAPKVILEACEQAIRELDVEAPQVYIEARFVELGNAASRKIGIDWSMLGGMTGTANLGGGVQMTTIGDGVTEYTRNITGKSETIKYGVAGRTTTVKDGVATTAGGADGSVTYFNGTLNFSQMALTLRALDGTEDSKTFSNPKIIVSSGKRAKVDMTTKYPNVKISAKRTEASASTSLDLASEMVAIPGEDKFMFAKESFFSWGISLEVVPRIGTNGLINVEIVPTISSQTGWVETGASNAEETGTVSTRYPIIKVQRLITEFNLESGTTAVIGGLSVTEENQSDTGIPLLRDIPWIGMRLFGSTIREKVQKEIIVFVTVGLVNPHEVGADAGLPKNSVLGRQYIRGQKLEPGDRPEKNMEGFDSLDMRLLEEQARDPLRTQRQPGFSFSDYIPFRKETDKKER